MTKFRIAAVVARRDDGNAGVDAGDSRSGADHVQGAADAGWATGSAGRVAGGKYRRLEHPGPSRSARYPCGAGHRRRERDSVSAFGAGPATGKLPQPFHGGSRVEMLHGGNAAHQLHAVPLRDRADAESDHDSLRVRPHVASHLSEQQASGREDPMVHG